MTGKPVQVPQDLQSTSASVRRLGLAATSACDRVGVLVHQGADLSKVATQLFGLQAEGMSAAALTTGNQQEASLLRAGAAPLIELLRDSGRLAVGEMGFVDVRSLPVKRQARETLRLLEARLVGAGHDVHVLAQPTFDVQVWGRAQRFRADFAVLPQNGRTSLGEKKSFHDFEADTDQPAMRALLDQGGAYYAMADLALRQSGSDAAADQLQPILDAVLRGPRVYQLDVGDERDRTLRLLSVAASADFDDVAADAARAAGSDTIDVAFVEALPVNRGPHCKACPLRNKCRDDAYAGGDLTILSTAARTAAAVSGTVTRAAAIVSGAKTPATHEQTLAAQGNTVRDELRAAGCAPRRFMA